MAGLAVGCGVTPRAVRSADRPGVAAGRVRHRPGTTALLMVQHRAAGDGPFGPRRPSVRGRAPRPSGLAPPARAGHTSGLDPALRTAVTGPSAEVPSHDRPAADPRTPPLLTAALPRVRREVQAAATRRPGGRRRGRGPARRTRGGRRGSETRPGPRPAAVPARLPPPAPTAPARGHRD